MKSSTTDTTQVELRAKWEKAKEHFKNIKLITPKESIDAEKRKIAGKNKQEKTP